MPHFQGGEVVWACNPSWLVHTYFCSAAPHMVQTWLTSLNSLFSTDVLTSLPPGEAMRLLCLQDTEASGAIITPGTREQQLPALADHQEDGDVCTLSYHHFKPPFCCLRHLIEPAIAPQIWEYYRMMEGAHRKRVVITVTAKRPPTKI